MGFSQRTGLAAYAATGDTVLDRDFNQPIQRSLALGRVLAELLGGPGVYAGGAAAIGDLDGGTAYPGFSAVVYDDGGQAWMFHKAAATPMTFNAAATDGTAWLIVQQLPATSPAMAGGGLTDFQIVVQPTADPAPANALSLGSGAVDSAPKFTSWTPAGGVLRASFLSHASRHQHGGDDELATATAAANAIPKAGGDGKLSSGWLPALALTDVAVVASQAAQLALTAQEGDVAVRTDQNKSYVQNGGSAGTMADWTELLTPTDAVLTVFGRTGTVTAQSGDYSAAQITSTPAGGLAATTVQAALNELDTDKLANLVSATNKLLGRSSAGAGPIEEIACDAVGRALLSGGVAPTNYYGSSTIVGWGAIATQEIYYQKLGQRVDVVFRLYGDSDTDPTNGAKASFTLPYARSGPMPYGPLAILIDNSVALTTLGAIEMTGSTVTLRRTTSSTTWAWTNAGSKGAYGQFFYFTS